MPQKSQAEHPHGHPHGAGERQEHLPRLIAWEVTRFCLLNCKHCRAAARPTAYAGELTTEECERVLDNIAAFARPIIILTGGEPMLRPDIYDIARYAVDKGLRVVMAPCGVLLNDETVARIAESGISALSISLDGATVETHDAFRGVEGAFDACVRGVEAVRRADMRFQINTTISQHNLGELPAILELAVELGAAAFNPFLLVPTGRGKELADQEISAGQYEMVLEWLADQQGRPDIDIRVTCAPHYQRVLRQHGAEVGHGRGVVAGCMGGKSFAFISHRGKVQICGFLDVECGDVRRSNYDFHSIWQNSEVFRRVRDVDSYRGRCGYCEYRNVCGGCRARAYAFTGDYLTEEPFCIYEPKRRPPGGERAEPELDETDRRVLSVIQTQLPVCERPYDRLAQELGIEPSELMKRVARLRAGGLIRRIGPIFDSKRLGYTSTLVAARIPDERLQEVADLVSELPGVTHNYRREHAYNLWFTLTTPSEEELECTLDELRRTTGIPDFYNMPALAVYKTRVNFRMTDEDVDDGEEDEVAKAGGEAVELDERQRALVRALQDDLPIVPEPLAWAAGLARCSKQWALRQVREWMEQGVVRRFGAVVRHRRLGFRGNGMAVFKLPEERVDEVGEALAQHPEVSHCYQRPPAPGWDYNLFAMVHGREPEEAEEFVAEVAEELELEDYDILFSTTEFKKTSMRYFLEGE